MDILIGQVTAYQLNCILIQQFATMCFHGNNLQLCEGTKLEDELSISVISVNKLNFIEF